MEQKGIIRNGFDRSEGSPFAKTIEEVLEKLRFGKWEWSPFTETINRSLDFSNLVDILNEERSWMKSVATEPGAEYLTQPFASVLATYETLPIVRDGFEIDNDLKRVIEAESPYAKAIEETLAEVRFGKYTPLRRLTELLNEERLWVEEQVAALRQDEYDLAAMTTSIQPRKAPMLSDQANVPTPMKIREAPMLAQADAALRPTDNLGRGGALLAR